MISTGIVQLLKLKAETDMMTQLGYPFYFLTILGTWKLLGVVAILVPKFPVVKEWAYAGFFFDLTAASYSHIASGDGAIDIVSPLLFLALVLASWALRPASRRLPSSDTPAADRAAVTVLVPVAARG